MTTIAITNTEIAADGQRTLGDEIRGLAFEKIRVRASVIYAFTGCAPMFEPMIKWHQDGALPDKLPPGIDHKDEPWTLVVIDPSGLHKFTSGCPYREDFDPPIAFGAGREYAMGAMMAGASAGTAVSLVGSLCWHSGGRVQVVNIMHETGFTLRTGAIKEAAE